MMTFLGVIAGIIITVLIVALIVKKSYSLERSIVIEKPVEQVFGYIKYLKNQDNYSKWATMDPDMKKNYTGIDGTPGFISAWDSDKKDVGKGEQEILKTTDNESIESEIRFIKPFAGVAQSYMATQANAGNSTTVKWGFASKMAYPMNIMLLFMNIESMIGKDLEIGLTNLKSILERTESITPSNI